MLHLLAAPQAVSLLTQGRTQQRQQLEVTAEQWDAFSRLYRANVNTLLGSGKETFEHVSDSCYSVKEAVKSHSVLDTTAEVFKGALSMKSEKDALVVSLRMLLIDAGAKTLQFLLNEDGTFKSSNADELSAAISEFNIDGRIRNYTNESNEYIEQFLTNNVKFEEPQVLASLEGHTR